MNAPLRVLCSLLLTLILINGCDRGPSSPSCTDPLGCVRIEPDQPIRIGVLQALSGKIAPLGKEQIRGLRLALRERNATLLGHPVSLQIEDTGCTPEGGANAALKIIADPQMVAIFGSTCSAAAASASQVMSDAGLVMVSGNNSAPFLTSVNGRAAPHHHPGYFRTAFNEENAGKTAAHFAFSELGVRRAATINDGDIYTRGLTEGFISAFSRLGGTIVLDTFINKGDQNMLPVLTAVKDSGAQLLFFPLFQPEGNRILIQARTMPGMEDIILMSDGALIEDSFIRSVGEQGLGMYFVGPAIPHNPAVQKLETHYLDLFKERPATSYYITAYDAAVLLLTAIERAAECSSNGSLLIGRKRLRNVLYAIKDYRATSGPLNCDQFGDCASPVFNILRLDDPSALAKGLEANVLYTFPPQP